MDQQRSKIPVATLANPEQDWLIPRRMLAWHQPDTGSKLPTIAELLAITIGGNHRSGDLWTDALDSAKSSTGLIGRIRLLNRLIVLLDVLIQQMEGFQQLGKPTPEAIRQTVFAIFQYRWNPATDLADPLANHNPILARLKPLERWDGSISLGNDLHGPCTGRAGLGVSEDGSRSTPAPNGLASRTAAVFLRSRKMR